ncbi:MATE family efflux transporter [Liquorilactobacillus satsumensis]|uniref:MATE family efflux transporter n=1 Tax=Liquorilactobacillus satsumensis TaxID=259059 RepID=UPI0021C46C0E|nr:MATE family efflux transporter [Liquorilactobacillus satsumensis]
MSGLLQQLYNLADLMIVGQLLGAQSVAAIGSTSSLVGFVLGFSQGITTGMGLIIARLFGARAFKDVKRQFSISCLICGVIAMILMVLSLVYVKQVLLLLGTPLAIFNDARDYILMIFAGIPISMAFNLCANMLRAVGNSRTPLVFLAIAVVINIVLNFVFILAFGMGTMGSALATVISQFAAAVLCGIHMLKNEMMFRFKMPTKLKFKELAAQLTVGIPMGMQFSIIAIGALLVQRALNGLGTTAIASSSVAAKVDQVAMLPLSALGAALGTYIAQNYGSLQYKRILIGIKQTSWISLGIGLFLAVTIIGFSDLLTYLFVPRPSAGLLQLNRLYFRVVTPWYLLLSVLFILRFTLQGLNYNLLPMIAGVVELIMRMIAALLFVNYWGYLGICLAEPLAWGGGLCTLLLWFPTAIRQIKRLVRIEEPGSAG